jgi:hypothetical protein
LHGPLCGGHPATQEARHDGSTGAFCKEAFRMAGSHCGGTDSVADGKSRFDDIYNRPDPAHT